VIIPKKVSALIRDKKYEGLLFTLGLFWENRIVAMYVLKHEIEMTSKYQENMGFIESMWGSHCSNVPANIKLHRFTAVIL
jgi:hypothetical protein